MPIELETKCTIRIAETIDVLLKDFKVSETTELENIPISKIMEIELIDFGTDKKFKIRTFNSSEQVIDNNGFTQWLFFVKPIRLGTHTLFLKVSVIQYIRGKERKKEIVLEREIKVVSNPIKAMKSNKPDEWYETNILLTNKKIKRMADPKDPNYQKNLGKKGYSTGDPHNTEGYQEYQREQQKKQDREFRDRMERQQREQQQREAERQREEARRRKSQNSNSEKRGSSGCMVTMVLFVTACAGISYSIFQLLS